MKLATVLFGGRKGALLAVPLAMLALPLIAPQVLAFPYQRQVGDHRVYAEMPITPALVAAVELADRKVSAGPLAHARASDQSLFLTNGGWRWTWLSFPTGQPQGLTRRMGQVAVLNRTDGVTGMVHSPGTLRRPRPVSQVVAHEMTHGSVLAHFGPLTAVIRDRMLVEGFCDYVAGGGTLTDGQALAMLAAGQQHPALMYWQGRKRVEALMARPGMTVDRLFAEWDAAES